MAAGDIPGPEERPLHHTGGEDRRQNPPALALAGKIALEHRRQRDHH